MSDEGYIQSKMREMKEEMDRLTTKLGEVQQLVETLNGKAKEQEKYYLRFFPDEFLKKICAMSRVQGELGAARYVEATNEETFKRMSRIENIAVGTVHEFKKEMLGVWATYNYKFVELQVEFNSSLLKILLLEKREKYLWGILKKTISKEEYDKIETDLLMQNDPVENMKAQISDVVGDLPIMAVAAKWGIRVEDIKKAHSDLISSYMKTR